MPAQPAAAEWTTWVDDREDIERRFEEGEIDGDAYEEELEELEDVRHLNAEGCPF